ncbi:hypothetical protein PG988_008091 [Apiospora saccharicola]
MRLSGLQKDVLSLYRQCLRAARAKPEVFIPSSRQKRLRLLILICQKKKKQATRSNFKSFARLIWAEADPTKRSEMNKSIQINKKDFAAIEFLLRKGRRQLEVYSAPGITDIHGSS